ncbi:hypothetical protein GZH46_01965, partial [Fragariocoptes setiger]
WRCHRYDRRDNNYHNPCWASKQYEISRTIIRVPSNDRCHQQRQVNQQHHYEFSFDHRLDYYYWHDNRINLAHDNGAVGPVRIIASAMLILFIIIISASSTNSETPKDYDIDSLSTDHHRTSASHPLLARHALGDIAVSGFIDGSQRHRPSNDKRTALESHADYNYHVDDDYDGDGYDSNNDFSSTVLSSEENRESQEEKEDQEVEQAAKNSSFRPTSRFVVARNDQLSIPTAKTKALEQYSSYYRTEIESDSDVIADITNDERNNINAHDSSEIIARIMDDNVVTIASTPRGYFNHSNNDNSQQSEQQGLLFTTSMYQSDINKTRQQQRVKREKRRAKNPPKSIYFGGFFPFMSSLSADGKGIGRSLWPAVRLALDHINRNASILRNYKLEVVQRDTQVKHPEQEQAYQNHIHPRTCTLVTHNVKSLEWMIKAPSKAITDTTYSVLSPVLQHRHRIDGFNHHPTRATIVKLDIS